jgi:hypothetical protein
MRLNLLESLDYGPVFSVKIAEDRAFFFYFEYAKYVRFSVTGEAPCI